MNFNEENKQNYDKLNTRLDKALKHIITIYKRLNAKGCNLALSTNYDGQKYFRFNEYPELREAVKKLQREFGKEVMELLRVGITTEWQNAEELVTLFEKGYFKKVQTKTAKGINTAIYMTNPASVQAFAKRREKGLGLSQKIWSQSEDYIKALEDCISVAIHKGTPARELSKQVEIYLANTDKLHRDNLIEFGTRLKRNDVMYKTMRLARSEINMSYRTAEQQRWQQADYILGYEIQLSNNHNCKGVPKGKYHDVCDELSGKYPKDFVWTGWHPNCRCFSTPILLTPDEFIKYQNGELNIDDKMVKDVPDNFKQWIRKNADRMKHATSLPYFIQDNEKYINTILSTKDEINVQKTQINEPTTPDKAKARKANKTTKEVADIQRRKEKRKERIEKQRIEESKRSQTHISEEVKNQPYTQMEIEVYKDLIEQCEKSLTESEIKTINNKKYGYVGTDNSFSINKSLRNNKKLSKNEQETVDTLRKAISLNKLPQNTILIRNLRLDYFGEKFDVNNMYGWSVDENTSARKVEIEEFEKKVKNQVITEKQFLSTSVIPTLNYFRQRAVQLRIKAPKGTHCYVPDNFLESECILDIGTKLKMVNVQKESGQIVIDCEIL